MRLVVPPLNESEARGDLVLINKKKHSAFLRVNHIIFNSFARKPDRTELIRCMLSIYLIMWPLSLMASFLHMSMAKSCMLAKAKTAWISQGNIQSSYFSEFSSNSFWGARTRCAILSEWKGPKTKHSPVWRFSSSASQIWQWSIFSRWEGGGAGRGILRGCETCWDCI